MRIGAGRIDVTAIASLAASLAAVAAIASALLLWRQLREENERARFSAAVESVWHLHNEWNSPTMLDIRSGAAASLLSERPSHDVAEVLDFFAEVTLLVNRGVVDETLVSMHFAWPMANYWAASRDYVQKVRHDQPAAWDDVSRMVSRLASVENQRRQQAAAETVPSAAEVHQFLLDEQGDDDECADDSDARKTPL